MSLTHKRLPTETMQHDQRQRAAGALVGLARFSWGQALEMQIDETIDANRFATPILHRQRRPWQYKLNARIARPWSSMTGAMAGAVAALWIAAVVPSSLSANDKPQRWDLCVATNGDDAWTGRLDRPNATRTDGPLATLKAARDAVRKLRTTHVGKDIAVVVRGGEYRLGETLVFSLADSAVGDQRIVYAAYAGERPVFVSAAQPGNWRPVDEPLAGAPATAVRKLWQADLPANVERPLSLYQGNRRLPRARGRGFQPTKGVDLRAGPADLLHFPAGTLDRLADPTNAELLILPSAPYEMNVLSLASVDVKQRTARTTAPASRPIGPVKFHPESIWVENALEALDEPGEWVVDQRKRRLYLWPIEKPPGSDLSIPTLTELVRIEGNIAYDQPADVPVRGIVLRGLTFCRAERRPWHGQTGRELQHCWEQFDEPTALVRLRGAERCAIEGCRLVDSSGAGIRLDLHCMNNRIADNEIGRLGGVGVLLAGYGPGAKDCNRRNEILNNWIHDVGELYWGSPAIFVWQSGENRVSRNSIERTPYSGVAVSGRISLSRTASHASARTVRWHELGSLDPGAPWRVREPYLHARKNLVEYNDISDVMRRMGDGNHIYVSGAGGGNHIRHNYLHDTDSDHMPQSIRCDDDQHETVIEGNVVFRCRCMHQAIAIKAPNDIVGNVLVTILPSRLPIRPRSLLHAYIGLEVYPVDGAIVQRNVIYSVDKSYAPIQADQTYGRVAPPRLDQADIDYNLYFCPNDPQWGASHLARARQLGVDEHSVDLDPQFVNLASGNLDFQPQSPVWALGFQALDLKQCGIRPDHPHARRVTIR